MQGRTRDADVEKGCVDMEWEGGGDGMNWDIGVDICTTTMCKTISGKLLYSTGSSAPCSLMTSRGGMEGGRKKVQQGGSIYTHIWLIHFVVQQKQNTVKQLYLNVKMN